MDRRPLSIRQKIFLVSILAIASPILMSNLLFSHQLEEWSLESSKVEAQHLSSAVSFSVIQWEQKMVNLVESVSHNPVMQSHSNFEIANLLREMDQIYSETYLIYVTDGSGKMIARSDGEKLLNNSDRNYIKKSLRGENSHEAVISKTLRQPAVCFSAPRYSATKKIIGTVAACALISEVSKSLSELAAKRSGAIFVADNQGQIVARTDGASSQTLESINQVAEDSKNRDKYLSVFTSHTAGWKILVRLDKSPILDAVNRIKIFGSIMAIISGAAVGLILLASIFLILKPITRLKQSFEAVQRGKFSERIEISRGDEFGMIAEAFNSMAEQLEFLFHENSDYRGRLIEYNLRLENDVIEKTQQLVAASKMSALGEMTGGIAHEINTPLATIQILVGQTLKEAEGDLPDVEVMSENLKTIERTTDRVAKIIKSLKAFARAGDHDPVENFTLQNIIDDALVLCRDRLNAEAVALDYRPLEHKIDMLGHPVELGQVILNLLTNSIDAVSENDEKWIRIETEADDTTLCIRVVDSGAGIPADFQEKIFQPFFTTKGVGKGTGLGLSLSHGIVERHGGRLFVDSTFNNTCFTICIPRTPPHSERRSA